MKLIDAIKEFNVDESVKTMSADELEQSARQAMLDHLQQVEERRQNAIISSKIAAVLPPRYAAADIKTLPAEIQQYAASVILHDSDAVLILGGDVGTGKTYAAAAIARQAIIRGVDVVFGTYREHLNTITKDISEAAIHVERMKQCDLLVIDDLGRERLTEYARETLYDILNARYSAMKPYVITTNLDQQELEKHLGDALYSRVRETAVAVELAHKYR